jgi:hypothetical protein
MQVLVAFPKLFALTGSLNSYYALLHPPPFFGWFRLWLRSIGEDDIGNRV